MDVVTGGRDCPTNSNKHTLQLKSKIQACSIALIFLNYKYFETETYQITSLVSCVF
jgi:hypothetical protein